MKVETIAKLRYFRSSPRKMRLLANLIRGLGIEEARIQLGVSDKRLALPLLKLLNSAVANAKHNNEVDEKTLMVKTVFVDGGPVLKRWMPRAMGRATPIRKRTSHVTIVVEGETEKKEKEKKTEKVKLVKKNKVKEIKKEQK